MTDRKDKNVEAIDIKKKEKAEKVVRDYLKPSCDEKISEEEYPVIKD